MYVNSNNGIASYNATYFDRFVETKSLEQKYCNIFCGIQAGNLIMCGHFYIDFILKDKSLLDYTNLLPTNEYEKNDKKILKYFQWLKLLTWKKSIALFAVSIENFKTLKYYALWKNISSFYYLKEVWEWRWKNI